MWYLPILVFQRLHVAAIDARRRDRSWRYLAYSIAAGAIAGGLLAVAAFFTFVLIAVGLWWLGIVVVGAMILPLCATLVIRHATVPLGLPRASYYLGAWFARATGKDAAAYGQVVAAWAIVRMPRARTGPAEAWLIAKRDARTPLGDAEVCATALVTAGRGDLATARMLMQSVTMLVESHPAVRELAGEWLCVDAAARGAWSEIARAADAATYPPTPLAWFLEGIAARKLAATGAPTDRELISRWLLAPRRGVTLALLQDVRAARPAAPPAPAASSTDVSGDVSAPPDRAPLPRAIAAQLALGDPGDAISGSTPTGAARGAFAHAVSAWDAALADEATYRWLAERARVLAAPLGAADRALREITAAIVAQLAAAADAAGLGAPASRGPVGQALAHRLRHGRLDSLEGGFSRWGERRNGGVVLPAIDEWREFIALHTAYTAAVAVAGIDLRRLAFQHAYKHGNRIAAWLWNTRSEYAMSHAISRWLYDEALAVGDAEAIELGHKNCSLVIPTRLGRIAIAAPPRPDQN